jgi:hypothetical protein
LKRIQRVEDVSWREEVASRMRKEYRGKEEK